MGIHSCSQNDIALKMSTTVQMSGWCCFNLRSFMVLLALLATHTYSIVVHYAKKFLSETAQRNYY